MATLLTDVVVLAIEGISPFELGVACEVFGVDRSCLVQSWPSFAVCGIQSGPIRTGSGFLIQAMEGLDRMGQADLVIVPWWGDFAASPPSQAIDALHCAVDRGARVMSFSSGAFALGHAGLLDHRRATAHWLHAAELARMFPKAMVDPDALYVADGQVLTSAGTAAAIDLSLHVVRDAFGPKVAASIAQRMVAPPLRCGGQSQSVGTPLPGPQADPLAGVLAWMVSHLEQEMAIDDLAVRAHMSARTFARRFRTETGTSPHRWLTAQRILHSQRLLEETGLPMELVAQRSGFRTADNLRHHFQRRRGVTPQGYRINFRTPSLPVSLLRGE